MRRLRFMCSCFVAIVVGCSHDPDGIGTGLSGAEGGEPRAIAPEHLIERLIRAALFQFHSVRLRRIRPCGSCCGH